MFRYEWPLKAMAQRRCLNLVIGCCQADNAGWSAEPARRYRIAVFHHTTAIGQVCIAHRPQSEFRARPEDADCDLASIGAHDLTEGCLSPLIDLRSQPQLLDDQPSCRPLPQHSIAAVRFKSSRHLQHSGSGTHHHAVVVQADVRHLHCPRIAVGTTTLILLAVQVDLLQAAASPHRNGSSVAAQAHAAIVACVAAARWAC